MSASTRPWRPCRPQRPWVVAITTGSANASSSGSPSQSGPWVNHPADASGLWDVLAADAASYLVFAWNLLRIGEVPRPAERTLRPGPAAGAPGDRRQPRPARDDGHVHVRERRRGTGRRPAAGLRGRARTRGRRVRRARRGWRGRGARRGRRGRGARRRGGRRVARRPDLARNGDRAGAGGPRASRSSPSSSARRSRPGSPRSRSAGCSSGRSRSGRRPCECARPRRAARARVRDPADGYAGGVPLGGALAAPLVARGGVSLGFLGALLALSLPGLAGLVLLRR